MITDQWHFGLRGIELIDQIRGINSGQPVILQSGNFADLINAFEQKYKDIPLLEKPYRFQKPLDLVQRMTR